ncbi:hypothetical protein FI667_g587, partial [Globisporangium splendens]
MYDAALRVQVHVGSLKDAECQKILPNVKKNLATGSKRAALLVRLQCVKSSGASEAAYTELFQEAVGFTSFSLATTTDDDLTAFLHSLNAKAIEAIDSEIIVEAGIHAAFAMELRMTTCCDLVLHRKGKALEPRFRVLHQVLKAMLALLVPLSRHDRTQNAVTRHRMLLGRRVDVMKAMERALVAAKRQEDSNLVETVCICAWNMSLPLLQPHLRSHVNRVFTLSAAALEDMQSLLVSFRARLDLEITKLEIGSEFLTKAYDMVNKALSLDYGVSAATTLNEVQQHEHDIATRPVDIHLQRLKNNSNGNWQWTTATRSQQHPRTAFESRLSKPENAKTQRLSAHF